MIESILSQRKYYDMVWSCVCSIFNNAATTENAQNVIIETGEKHTKKKQITRTTTKRVEWPLAISLCTHNTRVCDANACSFHFVPSFPQRNLLKCASFSFSSVHCFCFYLMCAVLCKIFQTLNNLMCFSAFCLISHLFTQWNRDCLRCLWWKNFILKINFIKMPCKLTAFEWLFHSKNDRAK